MDNTVTAIATEVTGRPKEIMEEYLKLLDAHVQDVKNGVADEVLEVAEFAQMMFISPKHLSNTIHEVTGMSPCALYEQRLLKISKELILDTDDSIASIARHLMYDPSNFSKFFKRFVGVTPKQYRDTHRA